MIKITKSKLEKEFGLIVEHNVVCMGFDTASRTGWCKASTGPESQDYVEFEYGWIQVKTTDKYFKYNKYIEACSSLIRKEYRVVVEETFFGTNAKTFQLLSRLGGFVYAVAHKHGVGEKWFALATRARKYLGIKGNMKKELVQKELIKRLDLKIKDEDIIDAIILSLNGILLEKVENIDGLKGRLK